MNLYYHDKKYRCGWIKLFCLYLSWKHKSNEPLFSERNGYTKYYRIGSYRFNLRRLNK